MNKSTNPLPTWVKALAWLVEKFASPSYHQELIGDLIEEYDHRHAQGRDATRWLLSQSVSAVWRGQLDRLESTAFARTVYWVTCLMFIPTVFAMVVWLSNLDDTSAHLWQALLQADLPYILAQGEYWQQAYIALTQHHIELEMFVNLPSALWLVAWAALILLYRRQFNPSQKQTVYVGLALSAAPYLWGYYTIAWLELAPTQLGPILAFMILAPLYTLPVLSVLIKVNKRVENQSLVV